MIGWRSSMCTRHEEPRHHREMERHVALVAVAEVGDCVLGPLVRLGQQHAILPARVDVGAQLLQERVRLGQVLAVGALALEEVGDRVEAQAVDAEREPEVEHAHHLATHFGIVEVQVGLMGVEAVPVVRLGDRIPGPVRALEVLEDDARVRVALERLAPHVAVAMAGTRRVRGARAGTTGADPRCG